MNIHEERGRQALRRRGRAWRSGVLESEGLSYILYFGTQCPAHFPHFCSLPLFGG